MTFTRFKTAIEVRDAFPTLADDIQTSCGDKEPLAFADELSRGMAPEDAISFCAYMLDRRKSVWWGCQCVRELGSPRSSEDETLIRNAEAWVRDPEEHRRLTALDAGIGGAHENPGTWLALAAGGSGGTFRLSGQPGPPVPPQMTAKSVRAAILIALASRPIRERGSAIVRCVDLARKIAVGG